MLGAVIAVLLICPSTALAQERAASTPNASRHDESGKAAGDGIKVHGRWTIDVRNADGTLASHNEFDNALVTPGAVTLAALLSRQTTVRGWRLALQRGSNGPCTRTLTPGTPLPCYIVEPGFSIPPNDDGIYFPTLALRQIETSPGSGNFDALELAGDVTAALDDQIQVVFSTISFNQAIFGVAGMNFSTRFLSPALIVAAGQRIYVKVVFSFS
jgi:hypothetical protein